MLDRQTRELLFDRLTTDLPSGYLLRDETEQDFSFIAELYAETRREELAPVPWSELEKKQFLHWQCRLQRDHYRRYYPNARFWILEHNNPIGRLYVDAGTVEIRIMDISLEPKSRNQGIGSLILNSIIHLATQQQCEVSLHVEPDNPAQRLYQRLGFNQVEQRGAYDFLVWRTAS
ncbi:GNAT family N-acetyltransferase [Methylocucumis oryzae]|uniref:N-acetyltransferase domain-containing protein n=1 Tax=Methylocucumis oryzae TaxID=1632867 RepID=A0A0F3IHZ1_9GAMM|nr:GNAT family N-acetyltransferase [Methylocucumis oryzae]KJV06158.1 hypothetical protein VZ94_13185 [Methylocucumis oryzae]